MNKEQIAQWVIDNRYSKSEVDKMSDSEMYYTLIDKIEEAINYTQCCAEFKCGEERVFNEEKCSEQCNQCKENYSEDI